MRFLPDPHGPSKGNRVPKRFVRGGSLVGEMPRSARHDSSFSVAGLSWAPGPFSGSFRGPMHFLGPRNLTHDRAPGLIRFGPGGNGLVEG